ncbi:MAG: hypothetical protein ACI8P0_000577 [Planctomycetaceae bacterium]|jgi:hypothetical protein
MSGEQLPLEEFQAALVAALYESDSLNEVRERLRRLPVDSVYREWSESFDDRMLTLAVTLTKQWAKRIP